MSYLMVHLKIGYRLLDLRGDIKDSGSFLLGILSPDAIMFRPGCIRSDKSKTHFCVGDAGWGYYTNYEAWMENLTENMRILSGTADPDFLFGYMAHIMTDIENTRRFWTPVRLTGDQAYISEYFRDCAEMDSVLFDSMKNTDEFWRLLEASNRHNLKALVSIEDNTRLIEKMKTEMYHDRCPSPGYISRIFTIPDVMRFMDKVVREIMECK